jgi:hypothetical protein
MDGLIKGFSYEAFQKDLQMLFGGLLCFCRQGFYVQNQTSRMDLARTHLKNVDQGSGQGAGRRKSGAYTVSM